MNVHKVKPTQAPAPLEGEIDLLKARYGRRHSYDQRYSLLSPAALLTIQERQRAIARLLARLGIEPAATRLLEVGCGTGINLLDFLRFGFRPEHLQGIELLAVRAEEARRLLPSSVQVHLGDAAGDAAAVVPPESQDIVYQATVFSSILNDEFQRRLAAVMWRWLKPGGGILWYDFTVNNPRNPDVRGVPLAQVRHLFPHGRMQFRRLTLAPPLARIATALHPALYTALNAPICLRTHVLVWVQKNG